MIDNIDVQIVKEELEKLKKLQHKKRKSTNPHSPLDNSQNK